MSASPSSFSQPVPHEAAGSGAETSRQGGEHCQRTVRRRHWRMLLCLSCLSAVFLVLLVLAVVYALVPESLAQQSLTSPRRCGDIPTWGEANLKDHYQLCTQNMCSLATCGPINESVCHMKPLVFEDKCKCCDWCLLRTVTCKHREESGDDKSVDRYFACQRPCYPLRPPK
ncbi:uncharacterized protein [Dermacentor andersoni]|uniref:uncharacterized protein n=1 Tax=Dermacentor andersoni TaxID=34620 RepID=UPI003B3A1B8A